MTISLVNFDGDKPIRFEFEAPSFGVYPHDLSISQLLEEDPTLNPSEILYKHTLMTGHLFPILIYGSISPQVYDLAAKMQKTLSTGRIVTQRDTVVTIERQEWRLDERSDYERETVDVISVGDVSKGIVLIEDNWRPSNPRISIKFNPPSPSFWPGYDPCGLYDNDIEIVYELPVRHKEAVLPHQRVKEIDFMGRDSFDYYSPFMFTRDKSIPEGEFMKNIVEFLSYDLDFRESDGSQAEWWKNLLFWLQQPENIIRSDRNHVGWKPFK